MEFPRKRRRQQQTISRWRGAHAPASIRCASGDLFLPGSVGHVRQGRRGRLAAESGARHAVNRCAKAMPAGEQPCWQHARHVRTGATSARRKNPGSSVIILQPPRRRVSNALAPPGAAAALLTRWRWLGDALVPSELCTCVSGDTRHGSWARRKAPVTIVQAFERAHQRADGVSVRVERSHCRTAAGHLVFWKPKRTLLC